MWRRGLLSFSINSLAPDVGPPTTVLTHTPGTIICAAKPKLTQRQFCAAVRA